MTIMFRIATTADDAASPTAEIGETQAAAIHALLCEAGARLGAVMVDGDATPGAVLPARFEARVCPLALAAIAAVADHDEGVIAVVEEAQFRARRIVVRRLRRAGRFAIELSLTSDQGAELDLAQGNAYALLESLGLAPDSVGEAAIDDVRRRLDNPAVRRRMTEQNVARYAGPLARLLSTAGADDGSRFEWA